MLRRAGPRWGTGATYPAPDVFSQGSGSMVHSRCSAATSASRARSWRVSESMAPGARHCRRSCAPQLCQGASLAGSFKPRAHSRRGPFASSRGRGCLATRIRPSLNLRFRSWRPSEGGAWWLDTPDASGRWFVPNRTSSSSGRPPPQAAFERPEPFRH